MKYYIDQFHHLLSKKPDEKIGTYWEYEFKECKRLLLKLPCPYQTKDTMYGTTFLCDINLDSCSNPDLKSFLVDVEQWHIEPEKVKTIQRRLI